LLRPATLRNESPPLEFCSLKCGDVLAKSVRLREIVGSSSSAAWDTFEAVPARVSLNVDCPTTLTVSDSVAMGILKSSDLSSPRLTVVFDCV